MRKRLFGVLALVGILAWVKDQMHDLSPPEALGLAVLAAVASIIETRTRRPWQTYGRLAIVSALVFDVLVISVAQSHGDVLLSGLTQLVMTILGLILAVTYERTETLR